MIHSPSSKYPLNLPLQFLYSNSSEKALAVIRGIQMIYFHLSAVRRGVNKLIVANVDSHMSTIPMPSKKDQIPLL
jgi:GTP:adenosylcobinamide-phosphate guanylyltransferase